MEAHGAGLTGPFRFARRPAWWKRRLFAPAVDSGFHLTFDDGPDPVETPKVLDILDRHGLQATFFLLGRAVAGHEVLLKRMVAAGHRLGNHTQTHPRFTGCGVRRASKELDDCQRTIVDACGVTPTLARPPFGRVTPGYLFAASRQRLKVRLWTLDSGDWKCRSADDASRCAAEVRAAMRPGDTILFHDNHRWIGPILEGVLMPADDTTFCEADGSGIRRMPHTPPLVQRSATVGDRPRP